MAVPFMYHHHRRTISFNSSTVPPLPRRPEPWSYNTYYVVSRLSGTETLHTIRGAAEAGKAAIFARTPPAVDGMASCGEGKRRKEN